MCLGYFTPCVYGWKLFTYSYLMRSRMLTVRVTMALFSTQESFGCSC